MNATIYAYGNGDFMYNILFSLSSFMWMSFSFFKLAGVICLLAFAIHATGVMPSKGYDWSRFIKSYLLLVVFVLTPYPSAVTVHDVLSNNDYVLNFQKHDSKKHSLPFGLIVPLSVVSTSIHQLIKLYQSHFQISENLKFTYSGMNFGANFITALENVNSFDDKFNRNLDQYMQNCGFPILKRANALSELKSSKDIFATLQKYTSASRFVQQVDFKDGNPIIKPCNQAIQDINSYYEKNKTTFLKTNAKMMGIDTGVGFTRFLDASNTVSSELLKISRGASEAMKQAIGMNMIMTALKNGAQQTSNNTLALAAYDAEQFQQYKKGGELSATSVARAIPVFVATFFALLVFLYPIMIFLAVALSSYKAVGVFFQLLVGINLIPLIYEILNYFSTFYLSKKLNSIIVGPGYTYDVATSLYSLSDNMIVAGNYLVTSAPLIAYAIVTGSGFALTQVFGHINDPAKQNAAQAGTDLARGNQQIGNASIDNVSFHNFHGNKLDNQLSMNMGVPIAKTTTAFGVNTNVDGENYDTSHNSQLLSKVNMSNAFSKSIQESKQHNHQEMLNLSDRWADQSSRAKDLSNSIASNKELAKSLSDEEVQNISEMSQISSNIKGTMSAKYGAFGVSAEMSGSISAEKSNSLQSQLSRAERLSNSLSHSTNQTVRDAFSKSVSLTHDTAKTIQDSVSISQAETDLITNQSSISTSYDNKLNKFMRDKGYIPTDMNVDQQSKVAQEFVQSELKNKYNIKTDISSPPTQLQNIPKNLKTPDANGLEAPTNADDLINTQKQSQDKFRIAKDRMQNHEGNIIANQIKNQKNTSYNVAKDTMGAVNSGIKYIVEKGADLFIKSGKDDTKK